MCRCGDALFVENFAQNPALVVKALAGSLSSLFVNVFFTPCGLLRQRNKHTGLYASLMYHRMCVRYPERVALHV